MIHKKTPYDYKGERMTYVMQYDKDVYFYLIDPYLTAPYPAHFCTDKSFDEALIVDSAEITDDGKFKVKIPNILLKKPKNLIVYVYVDFDGGERSIYRVDISVLPRAKPADYVDPDDDDYINLLQVKKDILEKLNETADAIRDELERDAENGRFDGKSPYIGDDTYWYVWDAVDRVYIKTDYSVIVDDGEILNAVDRYLEENPLSIRPLVFDDMESAEAYATEDESAYVGQLLVVLDETGSATTYVIANSEMELKVVGEAQAITSYNELLDKPSINGVVIQGALTSADLMIDVEVISNEEIDEILRG